MHRFHVSPESARGDTITLTGSEAHHATRVLRIRSGERAIVLDGAGHELTCEVSSHPGKSVVLAILQRRSVAAPPCPVTLIQAIPKAKLIESIIQKATELGVTRIVPILSERVVTHLDRESAEAKRAKWQQIAIEAIKQCGNAWLPQIDAPVTLPAFLSRGESFELALVGCLEPGSRPPREWFDQFVSEQQRLPRSLCVWIGPEGDFSSGEYAAIRSAGARPITLGPLVLRVETAATYCLSVVNHELQARGAQSSR